MKGHVKKRGDRYYAVIYEGRDPVTGKERRSWHPAGTDRAEAERLAAKLAATETRRVQAVRSLTFGAYLTSQWLPAKKLHLATSTYRGYERNVQRHILPALGRVGIRRLRYQQIEALYDSLLHPVVGKGLAPKTVYEIHLIIKGALSDALRRGLITRNVAVVARAPKQRSLQRIEGVSLTDEELRQLMRTAVGHRLFPLYWLTAMTGMRRNEVLGLRWPDIDFAKKRLHLNRGLVAVGYEVHQTRGKTKTARRSIDLDDTTLTVLAGWRAFQTAEFAAVGVTNDDEEPLTWDNSTLVRDDAVEAVRAMKKSGSGLMSTIGSISLSRSLLRAGLGDRFRVVMFPVITGATGSERIYDGYPDVALEMIDHRTFDGRIQLVEYRPRVLEHPPLGRTA